MLIMKMSRLISKQGNKRRKLLQNGCKRRILCLKERVGAVLFHNGINHFKAEMR